MTKKRPQNKRLSHISAALDIAMEPFRNRYGKGDFQAIWHYWEGAVGSEIAKNAKPISFRDGCLLVAVASSVWMQHLQFLKPEIKERINTAYGSPLVQDIRLRIGVL